MRLATAYMELTVKDSAFKKAMRESRTSLTRFTSGASKILGGVTKAMAALGVAAGVTSAAFTLLAVQTTRSFARFQQSMAQVSTLIRKDWQRTTEILSDGVRKLSLEIPQSTAALSSALYDIVSAGVPAARSIETLGIAGKAAVAGVSEVATASNLLTGTINGMGLALDDLQKVSDLAFSTVEKGVITFTQLSGSIGRAMSGANKLGASVEELYGSMAFLTKQNLSAEMSATALGSAFSDLASKSEKLEGMGVRVFGKAGEYRGILAVIEDIAVLLDGLTQQAKVKILEEMGFEERAGRAIIAMTTNLESFRSTMSDVADSAGATERAYDKMKDTLINQWSLLKNSVNNLGTIIGESLAGGASEAIKAFKNMVDRITTMIEGAGGLGNLWREHADVVTEIFRNISAVIIRQTAIMMKAIGEIIIASAPLIFKPLVFHGKKWFQELGTGVILIWNDMLTKIGVHTKEQSEKFLSDVMDDLRAKQNVAAEDYEKAYSDAIDNIVAKATANLPTIGTAMLDTLKGITAAFKEAAEATSEFIKAAIPPEAIPSAPGVVPVTIAPDTSQAKAAAEKLVTDMQNIWWNFFGRRRQAAEEAAKETAESQAEIEKQRLKESLDLTDATEVERIQMGVEGAETEADEKLQIWNDYYDLLAKIPKRNEERIAKFRRDISKSVINDILEADSERRDRELAASIAHAERITELWDNVAETIGAGLEEMFNDVLSGQLKTWQDFFAAVGDIFKREMAKMAASRVSSFVRGLLPGAEGEAGVVELDLASTKLVLATTALVPASASLAAAAASLTTAAALIAGTGAVGGGGAGLGYQYQEFGFDEGDNSTAPARQIRKASNVGMTTNHFHTTIQITEFDMDTMSQAKVNAWMDTKGYNALKNMAGKGKINKSMMG